MLTSARSEVYDLKGLKIYESNYSDDVRLINEDIEEMVTLTTPIYLQGRIVNEPEFFYKPFVNVWERYKNTHVYHEYGKNPVKGNFNDIGIQYGDNDDKIKLISNNCGSYVYSNESISISEEDIVIMLEEAYKMTYDIESDDMFDYERYEIIDEVITNYISNH